MIFHLKTDDIIWDLTVLYTSLYSVLLKSTLWFGKKWSLINLCLQEDLILFVLKIYECLNWLIKMLIFTYQIVINYYQWTPRKTVISVLFWSCFDMECSSNLNHFVFKIYQVTSKFWMFLIWMDVKKSKI